MNYVPKPEWAKWAVGALVTKVKGSSWTGHIVGYYSTGLTEVGYCVESVTEKGSVQIYPESALELVPSYPDDSLPVLADILHQGSLGVSRWKEVVYYDTEVQAWKSYQGSKTFEDGEQVLGWHYV